MTLIQKPPLQGGSSLQRNHLLGFIWLKHGFPYSQVGKETALPSQGTNLNNGDAVGIGLHGVKTPKECFNCDPETRGLQFSTYRTLGFVCICISLGSESRTFN